MGQSSQSNVYSVTVKEDTNIVSLHVIFLLRLKATQK